MGSKQEYQIPGMPFVGVPGNRKPINAGAIEVAFKEYNAGNSLHIDRSGQIQPPNLSKGMTLEDNDGPFAELRNIRTSMAKASPVHTKNPYQLPNPRRDSFMPTLAGKRVTVVGLGGGAPIPMELLKCGVDQFDLVDYDILEAGNAVRHPCPKRYFGRLKVEAVREHMHELSGEEVNIRTHAFNVFEHRVAMAEMIQNSDLLVVATDTEASRHFLNEIAVEVRTPAIYVGMFENGSGGEIFAALPDKPCYACLAEHLGREKFLDEYRQTLKKRDCTSIRDVQAMPGLGIDQGMLALIAARKCVDVLLNGLTHSLPPIGTDWIIFSIFGIPKVLESSLDSYGAPPARAAQGRYAALYLYLPNTKM